LGGSYIPRCSPFLTKKDNFGCFTKRIGGGISIGQLHKLAFFKFKFLRFYWNPRGRKGGFFNKLASFSNLKRRGEVWALYFNRGPKW